MRLPERSVSYGLGCSIWKISRGWLSEEVLCNVPRGDVDPGIGPMRVVQPEQKRLRVVSLGLT